MRYEPLEIGHRRMISECLCGLDEFISDFTFSVLFLYGEKYKFQIVHDSRPVFIFGTNPVGQKFLVPLIDLRKLGPDYIAGIMPRYDFMYPVAEHWTGIFDGRFELMSRGSEMDYVYRTAQLASFKGGDYNRRRNRLRHFTTNYGGSFEKFTENHGDQALAILRKWQDSTDLGETETDYRQCACALRFFTELPLCGLMYYGDGKPIGFLLGEYLNPRVFLIHFIKGLPGYQGLYEYMFNRFAGTIPGCEFINMEEDMGRENLRLTKTSYHPEFLVRKFRVCLRK